MSIRNIISMVESLAPSVQDIEENIANEADAQAVSGQPAASNATFFDRMGQARPYTGTDLEEMAMEGWAMVTAVNSFTVGVKYDGRMVTRQALESAIKAIEATQADTIHLSDSASGIEAPYSIWFREKGLKVLKTALREIKYIRDPNARVQPFSEDLDS